MQVPEILYYGGMEALFAERHNVIRKGSAPYNKNYISRVDPIELF